MAESVAAGTNTAIRAFATFLPNASNAPSLTSHMATWGNLPSVAPSLARTGVGTYTLAWPPTVNDEIGSGPGFTSPHTLNFLAAWANAASSAAFWHPQVVLTAANIATIYLYGISAGTPTILDPTPSGGLPQFTVFVV
jgi:hypothetical protein